MSKKILGIACFYHDSSATLIVDGKIVAALQEERFTRKKHDSCFPKNAIAYCLKQGNLSVSDIDIVAFYDNPFKKIDRIFKTCIEYAPKGFKTYIEAVPMWLTSKLWMKSLIRKELGSKVKVVCFDHHQSHAASSFFPSPFKRAAFLTMDGVGEWTTTSFGVGKENEIKILGEIHFPNSLGLLYSAFTAFMGFRVNSGEYKVMGLAPYGQPKYARLILEKLIDLKDDGSFEMNMNYFGFCSEKRMFSEKFIGLFGTPRTPETRLTQREMDLARSIQVVCEEVVLRMARHVKKITNENYLCLAGGVALNCVINGKLLKKDIFKDIWVQPAAGDAGGSLGAAYMAHCHYYNLSLPEKNGIDLQQGSYLGSEYSSEFIKQYLDGNKLPYIYYDDNILVEKVANFLAENNVVGWFEGRMEFGPRALGGRSILGDARSPQMQKKMNLKIKFRESFRPFAPSVLAEKVEEWFDIDRESPYMLVVVDVNKSKRYKSDQEQEKIQGLDRLYINRSEIPAVTHVDYSARVQTVTPEKNKLFYKLIKSFYNKTKCPAVVNTSFNVRGEPLVESPKDAYNCFMRTDMDVLVLGNYVILKEDQPKFNDSCDWKKEFELD
jgi:carbamoyltransferase